MSVCCEEVVVAVARGGRKRAGNERTAAWAAAVANLHACAGVRRYVGRLARHGDRGGVRRATSCDGCTHGARGHVGRRESENAEHFVVIDGDGHADELRLTAREPSGRRVRRSSAIEGHVTA